jgi:hypothetical protein
LNKLALLTSKRHAAQIVARDAAFAYGFAVHPATAR